MDGGGVGVDGWIDGLMDRRGYWWKGGGGGMVWMDGWDGWNALYM